MLIGRWSQRLSPLSGELLSSCLARNAAAHGTTPYRFLALFWQGDPVWERDFDRDPAALLRRARVPGAATWVDDLAASLGVAHGVVEAATLAPWRPILGGPQLPARGDTPFLLSAGVHNRSRLWPPPAAISSARRAVSIPRTSARSGPGAWPGSDASGSGGVRTWVPRK